MDVIKKYKVFCVTENQFIETWKVNTPQCCPSDYRHTIDPSQTKQIDQQFVEVENTQHVNINSKNFRNTNGIYCGEGRSYIIPPNVTSHIENIDIPVPMCVFGMRFCVRSEHMGDTVSFIGQPETIAGVILQTVNDASGTTFAVNNTVTENVVPGYYIVIGGEERQVVDVNSENNTITVSSPFTLTHNPGSYVAVNVYVVRNYMLDTPGVFEVGYGAFGGKVLPKGAVLRMIYNRNGDITIEKMFSFNVEYMY